MTSHTKTFLTVSVRTVERTASEQIRNGSKNSSKRLHWTAEDNLWLDEVERLNGCGKFSNGWGRTDEWLQKFLNGWGRTDERLRKIFERMKSNGSTAAEKFWTDEVEQLNGWRKGLNGRNRTAEWLRKSSERQKSNGWMNVASGQKHKLNELLTAYYDYSKVKSWFSSENWLNWSSCSSFCVHKLEIKLMSLHYHFIIYDLNRLDLWVFRNVQVSERFEYQISLVCIFNHPQRNIITWIRCTYSIVQK